MKKYIIAIGLSLTIISFSAQNDTQWSLNGAGEIYNTSLINKVGIGALGPFGNKLEITTSLNEDGVRVIQTGVGGAGIHLKANSLNKTWTLLSAGSGNSTWGSGNFAISDHLNFINAPRFTIRTSASNPNFPSSTGNVGIENAFPDFKLDIITTVPDDGIRIQQYSQTGGTALYLDCQSSGGQNWGIHSLGLGHPAGAGNFVIYQHPIGQQVQGQYRFFINNTSGFVGIGTNNPLAKLTVDAPNTDGVVVYAPSFSSAQNAKRAIYVRDPNAVSTFNVMDYGAVGLNITDPSPTAYGIVLVDYAANTKNFVVLKNGTVYAREIFVNLGTFPDYVFSKEHKLMPLDELERFITNNHHLPNVPSAKEVKEKGLGLGDLSKIQMEKIEELTLYILELKKEIDILKNNLK